MPSETRSERVWKRLLQAYGARFTDSFGLKPSEPWIAAIEDLTNDQISFGIRACLRLEPVHPPTLGVFRRPASTYRFRSTKRALASRSSSPNTSR